MLLNLASPSAIISSVKSLPYPNFNFFQKLLLFLYYKIADRKERSTYPPFGIRMYVGMPGKGKTISMVRHLMQIKQKYPKIKIYTNFGFPFQDAAIKTLDDIALIQDEFGSVFAVDEVQLSFQARQFGKFPPEMIFVLTQNRKFRKYFVCTAQLYEHVDKVFRDLTNEIVDCNHFGGRWFFNKSYHPMDYRRWVDPTDLSDKAPLTLWKESFIATDRLYSMYDTSYVVKAFNEEISATVGEGPMWSGPKVARPHKGRGPELRKDDIMSKNNILSIKIT